MYESVIERRKGVGNGIGKLIPDGYFTSSEVASIVGVSEDTIKRWRDDGIYNSTHVIDVKTLRVHLYTVEDIERMKAMKGKRSVISKRKTSKRRRR